MFSHGLIRPMLVQSGFLVLLYSNAVASPSSESAPWQVPGKLQIWLDSSSQIDCPIIDERSSQPLANCKLASLAVKIPPGFRLEKLTVEANFAGTLKSQGDLIGAVVRTRLENRTLSTSDYTRVSSDSGVALPLQEILSLRLEFPRIGDCQSSIEENFDIRSSYMVNFAGTTISPELRFKDIKVVDLQLNPINCTITGE